MKNILFFCALICISLNLKAQGYAIGYEKALAIKNATVLVALTDDEEYNKTLKTLISDLWKFTPIEAFVPRAEGLARAKKESNIFLLDCGTYRDRDVRYENDGPARVTKATTGIETVKVTYNVGSYVAVLGKEDMARLYVPSLHVEGSKNLKPEMVVFGVSALQYMLNTMIREKTGNLFIKKVYNKRRPNNLGDKTLLIRDFWYDSKLKDKDLQVYSGKIEKVDYAAWSDVILNKKPGYAYVVPTPNPMGDGEFIYQHYIMDSETGEVIGLVYPFMGGAPYNVTKKMLKMYESELMK